MDEVLNAYRISQADPEPNSLPHYSILLAAISSNHSPRQIFMFGLKIGMIIPPQFRYSHYAYRYFVENFHDYCSVIYKENIFERKSETNFFLTPPETRLHLYSDEVLLYFIKNVRKQEIEKEKEIFTWVSRKDLERQYMNIITNNALYPLDWTKSVLVHRPTNVYFPTSSLKIKAENINPTHRRGKFHIH